MLPTDYSLVGGKGGPGETGTDYSIVHLDQGELSGLPSFNRIVTDNQRQAGQQGQAQFCALETMGDSTQQVIILVKVQEYLKYN